MLVWSKNNFASEVLKLKSEFRKGNTYHAEARRTRRETSLFRSQRLSVKSVFDCS
jgi:hypothetical protein